MTAIRRIVFASDFSSASRAAFRTAVDMARTWRAQLVVIHVLAPLAPTFLAEGAYVPPKTWEQMETATRNAARKHLDALVRRARAGGVRATAVIGEGPAAERIVAMAKRQRAGLLVLGTHGRTGLARAFLGSVAGRVVAMASCPVLTVRGR
ncbi:MAG: universal stress protein [Candidatus Rokubacteria bacterium]|nr:universal stress protein [Candidatus Rokubacteria bacterium]